jgi:hypothetical protein
VAPLDLGLALDGLAVGDLGRLQDDVGLVAALDLFHGQLDVQLAHAGQEHVAGLVVADQMQVDVLFQELLDRREDLVFLALFLCGQRVGMMEGLKAGLGRTKGAFSEHSVSPVTVFLSLATATTAPGPTSCLQGLCFLPSRKRIWPIFPFRPWLR